MPCWASSRNGHGDYGAGFPEAERAMQLASRLPERERTAIEATYYALAGDSAKAIDASRRNTDYHPDEPRFLRILARNLARREGPPRPFHITGWPSIWRPMMACSAPNLKTSLLIASSTKHYSHSTSTLPSLAGRLTFIAVRPWPCWGSSGTRRPWTHISASRSMCPAGSKLPGFSPAI